MAHLLAVCALVQEDGGSEDEAVAALLHDALEDRPDQITRLDIERRFGPRVLLLIDVSTDTPPGYRGGPKPPWRQRKEAYLAHARAADPSLLRVTIADKIDNIRPMLVDHRRLGEALWARFHAGKADQLWYYQACLNAYETAGCKGPLMDELRSLVRELTRLAGS